MRLVRLVRLVDGPGTRVAVLAGLTGLLLAAAGGCWLGLRAAEPDAAIPSPTEVVGDTGLLTSSAAVERRFPDAVQDRLVRQARAARAGEVPAGPDADLAAILAIPARRSPPAEPDRRGTPPRR